MSRASTSPELESRSIRIELGQFNWLASAIKVINGDPRRLNKRNSVEFKLSVKVDNEMKRLLGLQLRCKPSGLKTFIMITIVYFFT